MSTGTKRGGTRLPRSAVRLTLLATFVLASLGFGPVKAGAVPTSGGRLRLTDTTSAPGFLSSAKPIAGGFNLVGVRVPLDRAAANIEVRTRRAGIWRPWQELEINPDEGPDGPPPIVASHPLWVGDAEALQVREDGAPTKDLEVNWVRSRGEPPTVLVPGGAFQRPAAAMTDQPAIVTRAGWGADESLRREGPNYASRLRVAFVHHTVGTNSYGPDESDDLVRGIYHYHVVANGFSDIGYNFLIDRYGQVFEGRYGGIDRAVIGAHAGGFNTGSFGASLMGTFTNVSPPPQMEDALARLLAWKLDVHHVDPLSASTMVSGGSTRYPQGTYVTLSNVSGHRDVSLTACPGEVAYQRVGSYGNRAFNIGLPKIFEPSFVVPYRPFGEGGSFGARLSGDISWQLNLTGSDGRSARAWTGTGGRADVQWNGTDGSGHLIPTDVYSLGLSASGQGGSARPYVESLAWIRWHPDGTLLRGSGPGLWMVQDHTRLPINSPAAFDSNFKWGEIAGVSDSTLSRYAVAQQVFRDGTVLGSPDGAVWVIADGLRRHVSSSQAFDGLHYSWSNVRWVSWDEIFLHQVGDPLDASLTHPDGTLIKGSTAQVFLIDDGNKRPVTTPAIFESHFRWEEILTVSDAEMGLYPATSPVGFRDGSLIETPGGEVWLISSGLRRLVPATAFSALGFSTANVRHVSAGEAALHAVGEPVGSLHPDGVLLKGGSSRVWVVKDGLLQLIGTGPVYESNFRWEEIVSLSDSNLARYPTAQVRFRDGTLLHAPDGSVWVISNGLRRHVKSEQDLAALGYSWTNVRWVSSEEIGLHLAGPQIVASGTHPDGTLVKGLGPQVYVLNGGAKLLIPNGQIFESRFRWEEIVSISDSEMAGYPTGTPIGFRDGSLVGTTGGKVWFVEGGLRHHIRWTGTFGVLGFSWNNVRWVTDAEASFNPEGEPVA